MLPHGGLPEMVSSYMLALIEKTGGVDGPLGRQFISQPEKEKKYFKKISSDPLIEDKYEMAPGMIYKYRGKMDKKGSALYFGRVLWTITRFCATYCRFCTRGRVVGMIKNREKGKVALTHSPFLSNEDIKKDFEFLKKHKEINEVILSGGDPLISPRPYLTTIIDGLIDLQKKEKLDIIRIHTRLPVHNPISLQDWHYKLIAKIKNPYIVIHINHPYELTDECLSAIKKFRKISGACMLSQTVLLKGVNDNSQILHDLFVKLANEGIHPYYLHHNDPVYWAKHFTVPIDRALKIWSTLRPRLSGIAASARFVIDTPFGYGKIPFPEGGAWDLRNNIYRDFKGKKQKLT